MSPLAFSLRLLQSQPDERLLALAQAGHEPAFEALVRRYRRPLLAYARRTAPDATAEDVLQQALLQAWRAVNSGVEVRDARAWLYRIVHNVAISTVRGAAERPSALAETVSAAGVEHLVEQRLAARDALAQLAALPDLQRQVMVETALEGRTHEEVGSALGLTGGSVRGLVYRARAALRAAAAALIPPPVIEWAARRSHFPPAGIYEALAGGGSAGAAGAVIKGGVIVTVAGAIAGGAVVATHPFAHRPPPRIVRLGAGGGHHGVGRSGAQGAAQAESGPGALGGGQRSGLGVDIAAGTALLVADRGLGTNALTRSTNGSRPADQGLARRRDGGGVSEGGGREGARSRRDSSGDNEGNDAGSGQHHSDGGSTADGALAESSASSGTSEGDRSGTADTNRTHRDSNGSTAPQSTGGSTAVQTPTAPVGVPPASATGTAVGSGATSGAGSTSSTGTTSGTGTTSAAGAGGGETSTNGD